MTDDALSLLARKFAAEETPGFSADYFAAFGKLVIDQTREDDAKLLSGLMKFQYENLGYGRLRCRSCGALASEDFDEDRHHFKAEPCSPICPWELAAAALRQRRSLDK